MIKEGLKMIEKKLWEPDTVMENEATQIKHLECRCLGIRKNIGNSLY